MAWMKSFNGKRLRNILVLVIFIRTKQTIRWIQTLGWVRFFILLLCVVSIFLVPILPFFVTITILLLVHLSRRDRRFLTIIHIPTYWVFFIEYMTIILPVITFGFFYGLWWYLLLLPIVMLLPIISSNKKTPIKKSFPLLNSIPLRLFEWRSGFRFRKTSYLLLAIYILLLVTGFKIRYVHMLSLIIVALIIVPGNYMNCEPFQLLEVYNKPAHVFLFEKFLYAMLGYSVLAGPFWVLSMIENYSDWLTIFGFLLAAIFIIANIVWSKYAYYDPGKDLAHATSSYSFVTLLYVGICFPPLLLFTSGWFYWKGYKRLKMYLYAYH